MNNAIFADGTGINDESLDPQFTELIHISDALNADCSFEQADELIRTALNERPANLRLAEQLTVLALQRGDWREARQRAAALRGDFPEAQEGYRRGIAAEIELVRYGRAAELQRESVRRFPEESWPVNCAAILAELRQNFVAAERLRKELCSRFPQEQSYWREWASLRLRVGRLEAAESVLTEALSRFPHDLDLHVTYAELAIKSGNTDLIEERRRLVAECFPNNPEAALGYAEAPVEFGKDKQWSLARTRYEDLNRNFPDFDHGYARHVSLLRRSGDFDGAEKLARTSLARFPEPSRRSLIVIELARTLESRGEIGGAIAVLSDHMKESPNFMGGYVMSSALLCRLNHFDEAESICRKAISRFKFRSPPWIALAKIATQKGDVDAAIRRWKRALYFVPKDQTIGRELFISRMMLAEKSAASSDADMLTSIEKDRSDGPLKDISMQFESLGGPGGGGCEFGLVQRNFGAEPIGLLRWASLTTGSLVKALEERFHGLGSRDQTEVRLPGLEHGNLEYTIVDTRYKISMHSWVMQGDIEAEALRDQWCGRLAFLRRKLLADLELGKKIFLYRPGENLTASQIGRLGAAVRSYGNNNLLVIKVVDAEGRNGEVRNLSPGVMVGYIDRLNWEPGRANFQPSFASWARICANALTLRAEADD